VGICKGSDGGGGGDDTFDGNLPGSCTAMNGTAPRAGTS
jgi:hypothetical protein